MNGERQLRISVKPWRRMMCRDVAFIDGRQLNALLVVKTNLKLVEYFEDAQTKLLNFADHCKCQRNPLLWTGLDCSFGFRLILFNLKN